MAAFVIVDGFVLFCLTAILILRMTPWMIQCYHHSYSYLRMITLPSFIRLVFVCFGFLFVVGLCLVLLFCLVCLVFSVGIVTAYRTLYRYCHSSLL